MRRLLLDTSGYSRLMAGDGAVADALGAAETVYLSVFVLGELLAGFRGGAQEKRNLELLGSFVQKSTVNRLDATHETAEVFASVKESLRRAGRPIPVNDVWIAAHAMETGSVLLSFDRHFEVVPGLRLWRPA
jgi:tRNA(fMet)-specific endonuclease VapC